MELFNEDGFSTEEEKTPTLKQYLKKMGDKKLPNSFLITKIWFPNKYPNYGIEADLFRFSVSTKSKLGKILKASMDELYDTDSAIAAVISTDSKKNRIITFKPLTNTGVWTFIGNDEPLGMSYGEL